MPKYDSLRDDLQRRSRDDTELTFREIEQILGFDLPASAYNHDAWWSNEPESHVQARAWLDAGWKVWHVRRSERKVCFRPREIEPTEPSAGVAEAAAPFAGKDAIVIDRASLRGGAVRILEDYREAHGGSLADAVTGLLNAMALERRRQLLEWVKANAPAVPGDSTDIIREARDAR